ATGTRPTEPGTAGPPNHPAPPTGATPPTDSTPRTGATGTRPTEPGTAGPPNHPAPPTGATPPTDSTPRTGATGTRPIEPSTAGPPDRPAPPTGSTPRAGAARSGETRAARAAAFLRPDAGGAPASQTDPGRPVPTSATDTAAGTHLAAYALGAGHGFVLGVASPQRAPGDHTVVSVAAVLLSLLTGEQQSGTGAARSSALVRLLLGAAPEEVAPLLGGGRWVVVRARPDGTGPADPVAASALGAALGSALVDPAGDVVRVLVPADRAPAPLPGWTLGVSAAVAPHDWPAADTQAARALARARATRTPLLRHAPRPALADLVPPGEAAAHARTLLAPVTAHPALTETLRTWLSLHGSWDRTAVALSVHRNTVRQRVTRCATLLETDLDDPDVRMELWFALRHV
ncbi:helix-turn-helix domain-containing protein, partial [Streptomyces collinus]|uniref:helix-turn-helix domain-containing protein n=1 Tax=Streptomyces collinus TaxID=42684 RepID=UPI0033E6D687